MSIIDSPYARAGLLNMTPGLLAGVAMMQNPDPRTPHSLGAGLGQGAQAFMSGTQHELAMAEARARQNERQRQAAAREQAAALIGAYQAGGDDTGPGPSRSDVGHGLLSLGGEWSTAGMGLLAHEAAIERERVRAESRGEGQRRVINDQTGVPRYADTGEPVYPGVEKRTSPSDWRYIKGADDVHRWVDGPKAGEPVHPELVKAASGDAAPFKLSDVSSLRKEFTQVSKPWTAAMEANDRIEAAHDNEAGDQALIMSYMKVLDPGSTVREGEFATVENARGVDERTRAAWNRLLTGERLTPRQRANYKAQARDLIEQERLRQIQREEDYTAIAMRAKLNPADIVRDLLGSRYRASAPPPAQGTGAAATGTTQDPLRVVIPLPRSAGGKGLGDTRRKYGGRGLLETP